MGYHRAMQIRWPLIGGWYQATVLALAPWIVLWYIEWVPLLVAMAVVVRPLLRQGGPAEPWAGLLVAISALLLLVIHGGWAIGGGWLLLAALVLVLRILFSGRRSGLPDAAMLVGLLAWGAAFALRPQLISIDGGGWLAPALLLLMARRLAGTLAQGQGLAATPLGPPTREVRGTLCLNEVVLAGHDGLVHSAPLDLELRAGESLAVICDAPGDIEALSQVLTGRRRPLSGELTIDGVPLSEGETLVALVASGEPFIAGDLDENLAALCDEELDDGTTVAVMEACSLGEITEIMEDRQLSVRGEPLPALDRLVLLAARVIPSEYRLLVVVDPQLWVNTVRGEVWRGSVVRASVGRTAIWITTDRELAHRATHTKQLRHGRLQDIA